MDDDSSAVTNEANFWLVTFGSQYNGNTDYIEKTTYKYKHPEGGLILQTSWYHYLQGYLVAQTYQKCFCTGKICIKRVDML